MFKVNGTYLHFKALTFFKENLRLISLYCIKYLAFVAQAVANNKVVIIAL